MAGASATGLFGMGGTGLTGAGVSNSATGFAGAYASFAQASADESEAGLYGQAANDATNEATAAQTIGDIQQFQLKRTVGLTESASRAAAAGNGLQEVGSAVDVLRETAMQGAMSEGNLTYQTELKTDQYKEQAYAAQVQEQAAKSAATASIIGGVLKGVSGAAAMGAMF